MRGPLSLSQMVPEPKKIRTNFLGSIHRFEVELATFLDA